MRAVARRADASLAEVVLSGVAALLAKYAAYFGDRGAVSIGHTVSMRPWDGPIGCYVNLVPVIIDLDVSATPLEVLAQVREARDEIEPHQHVPLGELLSLADEKAARRGGLLNVLVNNSPGLFPRATPHLEGLEVTLAGAPAPGGPFDLSVNCADVDGALRLSVEGPLTRCAADQLSQIAQGLRDVFKFFAAHPADPIAEFRLQTRTAPAARGAARGRWG